LVSAYNYRFLFQQFNQCATVTFDAVPGAFSAIFTPAGQLLVNETGPAGATDGSTIWSYDINPDGSLVVISSAIPTYGGGNCWSALTPDGKRVYVSNSSSDNVAGFNVAQNGALGPIGSTIVGSSPPGSHNVDVAINADGTLLYTQNTGTGTIGVFSIQNNGTLLEDEGISGLPQEAGFNGLAAF
jgi:6-phosphogluconolactonase